jgi:short-subunit dehydrogenase
MTRPVALVTGASAGIGRAFAIELAARGHDLVLTARRRERLDQLAAELHKTHGARSHVVALDLADPAAPAALAASVADAGMAVDVLVNNAGYGVPGSLVSQPWPIHRDFIQVMMTAPVELCWRFLPGMRERKRGTIINVASLAGLLPGSAGHTLYGAAKAFLIRFSQSLAFENGALGIKVLALCPGFTYSEFHDVTGTRPKVSQLPKWMWMSAEDVVREGLDAVARGRVVHVTGRPNRLIKALVESLPDRAAEALMRRQSRRFRAAD